MRRGTTPTLTFSLPFNTDSISVLNIAFAQKGNIVIEKGLEECELEADVIRIKFTQLETLSFDDKCDVDMQIRVKTKDGNALASNIIRTRVDRIIKDGEL